MIEFIYTGRLKNRSFTIPESYNELSGKQLIALAKVFQGSMSVPVAELEALRILLKLSRIRFYFISIEAIESMLEHIQWIFEKNTLTKQLIPCYRHKYPWNAKFYGPSSDWDNLTMAEWSACEVYYEWMINNHHPRAMDFLIAVLYRVPKKKYNIKLDPEGDIRVEYNHHETDYWSQIIAKWPSTVKMSIITWYDGCREAMVNNYDVFESGTSEQDKKSPGMFELIRGLCGTRYGGFEKVEKMNVHKALREMELLKEEAEKIKNQAS